MESLTKGNAAESAVLNAFVEAGYDVLVPFGEGQPYDLVVHLPSGQFLRVQCKTAREVPGCVVFNSRMTDHGRGRLSYRGLADIFGVYAPSTGCVYLVPVGEVPGFEGRLRVQPTRNNQQLRVRHARHYQFTRWTAEGLAEIADASRGVRVDLAMSA